MAKEQFNDDRDAAAKSAKQKSSSGLIDKLASVGLALWLLGVLTVAMAIATIIPQRMPPEAYERAFGIFFGPLVGKTTLSNIYGAWWFIGAFLLLALSLTACALRRAIRLTRAANRPPAAPSADQIMSRPAHARLSVSLSKEEAFSRLAEQLRKRRYSVEPAAGQESQALTAARGGLRAWASVLVHIGMVLVLLGAGYGRFPANTRLNQNIAILDPGETFTVEAGKPPSSRELFSIRLLDAGSEHDPMGRPTRFWAQAEVIEDGQVLKTALVEPNQPIRRHAVSVTLQALPQAGYAVEVGKGDARGLVPVVFGPQGGIDMMATIRRLEEPPWVVFIHDFREPHPPHEGHEEHASADDTLAARVYIDKSGELTHNWEAVGWVDAAGLEFEGVSFRLVSGGQGAQFALDRDVGVPVVWSGFGVMVLGTLLLIAAGTRRSMAARVREKGTATQILLGGSGAGVETDIQRISENLKETNRQG